VVEVGPVEGAVVGVYINCWCIKIHEGIVRCLYIDGGLGISSGGMVPR
jgi:hypothetical protein